MDNCRWASYMMDSEQFMLEPVPADLPKMEQVNRGKDIMKMLQAKGDRKVDLLKKSDAVCLGRVDWDIVVKHSFIEVVIPDGHKSLTRSLSDSALPCFREKLQWAWKSLVSDKVDMSDASTNDSIEADDLDANCGGSSTKEDACWSSEGEDETPQAQQVVIDPIDPAVSFQQCQYMEPCMDSWWMSMNGDWSATGFDPSAAGFEACYDQSPMGFAASSFMMNWTECGVDCNAVEIDVDAAQKWQTDGQEWRTTVMIRNMPNNYTREMLLELVDSMGFAGTYDFAYLPVDFQSQAGLGYAFINFSTIADALLCFERFEGFSDWKVPSEKVCTVTWSSPTQGLQAHIERYKNSPVMHHSLPDEWKPVLLQLGVRIAFPPPSKPIKTPKVRQHAHKNSMA